MPSVRDSDVLDLHSDSRSHDARVAGENSNILPYRCLTKSMRDANKGIVMLIVIQCRGKFGVGFQIDSKR